jgi:hypothetical protein
MKYDADEEMTVSLGSLDRPENVVPSYSVWVSKRLPWTSCVAATLKQFPVDPA